MASIESWLWLILRATFALGMLLVLGMLEYVLPIYVPLWVYVLITAFSFAVLYGLSRRESKIAKIAWPALFTLGLVWLFSESSDSSQAMMRHLHRVKPGMNVTQVEAIMQPYSHYNRLFGIRNTRRLPSGELVLVEPDFAVYKHSTPNDGAYNAAVGIVNFKNGKVTGVEYHGD